MKKVIALFVCIAVAAGCMITAHAALPPLQIGDVNQNFTVEITDATMIQRLLAHMPDPNKLQLALGDADGDGEMTILDATELQRWLAGIPSHYDQSAQIWDWYIGDASWHSTAQIMGTDDYQHSDEICYVGVPVTFTGRVRWGVAPLRYTLEVDGEKVAEAPAVGYSECRIPYTFTEEGEHTVVMTVEYEYDRQSYRGHRVTVRSLPEDGRPVIMGATFFDESQMLSGNGVLTVTAAGGTAPYQYQYEIDLPQQEASCTIYYCSENELDLSEFIGTFERFDYTGVLASVTVTVRDSLGNVSDPVTVDYIGYEMV